jgi:hypothetical protein
MPCVVQRHRTGDECEPEVAAPEGTLCHKKDILSEGRTEQGQGELWSQAFLT